MSRSRSRSRSRSGSGGSLTRKVAGAFVIVSLVVLLLNFGAVGAFTTGVADRVSEVGVASGSNALLGIETASQISIPSGSSDPAGCSLGSDVERVSSRRGSDVDTDKGVVIESGARVGDVDADGGVIVKSSAQVSGDIDTDGCVKIESGARVSGDVDAGGDVVLESGGRIGGDVDGDGSLRLESGSRTTIEGDVDVDGSVTVESGATIAGDVDADGSVTVESGATIEGDVDADGNVTVESGGRIKGDISEGSGSSDAGTQELATFTNNVGQHLVITVTLMDSDDGTLEADSDSGSSVEFTLQPDEQQTVEITPTSSAGSAIQFQVTAEGTDNEFEVTLDRTVPTVTT